MFHSEVKCFKNSIKTKHVSSPAVFALNGVMLTLTDVVLSYSSELPDRFYVTWTYGNIHLTLNTAYWKWKVVSSISFLNISKGSSYCRSIAVVLCVVKPKPPQTYVI